VPGSSADLTPQADPASVARTIALRQLAAAPRTRAQLDAVLARRGVPEEVAAELLDRLEEVGLVDDAEYSRVWVESRQARRGLSRRALRQELVERGVDPELVREAVDVVDDAAELAAATALLRRRMPAAQSGGDGARPDPRQALQRDRRLLALLARRGYSAQVAHRALQAALAESGAEAVATPSDGEPG
jgi:regulatory protein